MTKVPNLKELKLICQPQSITHRGVEHWYGPIYRWIDLRTTWLLLHYQNLTPNMITIPNLFIAAFGGFSLLLSYPWNFIFFFLTFQLWVILDGVDGEVARYTKNRGLFGPAVDTLGHFLIYFGLFIPLGLKISLEYHNFLYLILGFLLTLITNLANLPEIAQNVILYKNNLEISKKSIETTNSLLIKIYRITISPMEISLLIIFLWLLLSQFPNYFLFVWKIFFIFYVAIFTASFFLNIFRTKKELDSRKI